MARKLQIKQSAGGSLCGWKLISPYRNQDGQGMAFLLVIANCNAFLLVACLLLLIYTAKASHNEKSDLQVAQEWH